MRPVRDTLIEAIALACHQQNRVWCIAHGDESQVNWSEAPDWQKESAIMEVEAALVDPRPEVSHERWLKHKTDDGWVYGPTKDVESKTHPCMVPYGDLPAEQKLKDSFFVSMVTELGNSLNLIPSDQDSID